jgi:hypothetical protein
MRNKLTAMSHLFRLGAPNEASLWWQIHDIDRLGAMGIAKHQQRPSIILIRGSTEIDDDLGCRETLLNELHSGPVHHFERMHPETVDLFELIRRKQGFEHLELRHLPLLELSVPVLVAFPIRFAFEERAVGCLQKEMIIGELAHLDCAEPPL